MIELSSHRWQTLAPAGGNTSLVPQLLRALSAHFSDDDWQEVWEQLGHQWTLYPVAYAALPYLIPIAMAHNLTRTTDFLISVGRLAAPLDTIEPCPPDLAPEFDGSLRACIPFALEAAESHHEDPRDYAAVLQTALALTGRTLPGVNLFFILSAGDPAADITCPGCSASLTAQFEHPVGVLQLDRFAKPLSRVVPITPGDPAGHQVLAWLTVLCQRATQDVVLDWLYRLFGTSACPNCSTNLDLLAEIARDNGP